MENDHVVGETDALVYTDVLMTSIFGITRCAAGRHNRTRVILGVDKFVYIFRAILRHVIPGARAINQTALSFASTLTFHIFPDCVIGPGRPAGGAYTIDVISGVTESDGLRAASDNTLVVCVALLRGTCRYTSM